MTLKEVGQQIGVTHAALSKIENARSQPSRQTLIALAKLLEDDFGIDWLADFVPKRVGTRTSDPQNQHAAFKKLIKSLRLEKAFNYKDVERNADGGISAAEVRSLESGDLVPETLSIAKLRSLARGLSVDDKVIFDAVRGYTPPPDQDLKDLMYEAFGGEEIDPEVLKKAIEIIKLTSTKK